MELAEGMVRVAGQTFAMGSMRFYPEERPVHDVAVESFAIDRHQVTTAQFRSFVEATGYVTVAERPLDPAHFPGAPLELLVPGALVFRQPPGPVSLDDYSQWWAYVPGANWRHPHGPDAAGAPDDHPVVQVAFEDAEAYATWRGARLPTEAEWELAARGGLAGAEFAWGDDPYPEGQQLANTWQGSFPWENTALDGYIATSPVASFPPNGFGLFDMTGNVWEWTTDWWRDKHPEAPTHACCGPTVDRTGDQAASVAPGEVLPRRVIKGGSHLCAPNYCLRFRPAARQPEAVDTATCHLGFRCVTS